MHVIIVISYLILASVTAEESIKDYSLAKNNNIIPICITYLGVACKDNRCNVEVSLSADFDIIVRLSVCQDLLLFPEC